MQQTIANVLVSHYVGRLGFASLYRCDISSLTNLEHSLSMASRSLAAPWKRAVAAALIPCVVRQRTAISGVSPRNAVFEKSEIDTLVAAADGNF